MCWEAIRQLLLSFEAFPLDTSNINTDSALYRCRLDEKLLRSCEKQIRAEIMNDAKDASYHLRDIHPVDPEHIELGFLLYDDFNELDKSEQNHRREGLSDVCFRLWAFFAMFYNTHDHNDHYASSVKNIIET